MNNYCDSVTKELNSASNINTIIATRTPARARQKSVKQDKFEFDAPQFEDFTQPRYLRKLQLLEQVVLPPEQRSEWTVHTVDLLTHNEDSATDDGDAEWFEIAHFEHEPSSPMSPAGPLITPIHNSTYSPMGSVLVQDTPHISSSPKRLFTGGLRSKPMRIPRGTSDASDGGSAGSLRSFYSEMEDIKSPTTGNRKGTNTRWQVVSLGGNNPIMLRENKDRMDPRTSISIERSLVGTRDSEVSGTSGLVTEDEKRIQSLMVSSDNELQGNMTTSPLNTNWSSIPATPLLLAAPLLLLQENDDNQHQGKDKNEHTKSDIAEHERKRSLPISARKPSPLTRRLVGLASRAMRVPASTTTTTSEANFFDSHDQHAQQKALGSGYVPSPLRLRISPVIKRVKVNARFCPAPLPRSRQPSPPSQQPKKEGTSKKERPVKLDDLKKLLAEHNQRLRPPHTNNITRRR